LTLRYKFVVCNVAYIGLRHRADAEAFSRAHRRSGRAVDRPGGGCRLHFREPPQSVSWPRPEVTARVFRDYSAVTAALSVGRRPARRRGMVVLRRLTTCIGRCGFVANNVAIPQNYHNVNDKTAVEGCGGALSLSRYRLGGF
jgi:hypothetical protein